MDSPFDAEDDGSVKSRMKKHRVGETFYLVTFDVRDGDSQYYPQTIYPESIKDMSDEELITEEFGEAEDDGNDYYWVGNTLVSVYNKKPMDLKTKELFEEYGMAAEEDTILAQLYEIEDMKEPSEEDLKNYRNLEIRYGELTRMDAEITEDVDDGCCFCGADYGRYGNNAQPLFDGRCCNNCNTEMVIPARISMMFGAEDMQPLFDDLKKQATRFTGMTILFTGVAAVGGYLIGRHRG
jgi:hypothetical protein